MAAAKKPANRPAAPAPPDVQIDRVFARSAGADAVLAMLDEDRRAQAILHRRHDEKGEHTEADVALAVLKYIEALAQRIREGAP